MTKRDLFLATLRSRYLTPYRWDSKGPDRFDCSGLVTWALSAVGAIPPASRLNTNCRVMWTTLPPTEDPQPGDLCFYGAPDAPDHVMALCEDKQTVYGAAGGNSDTTTDEIAAKRGAAVQYRPLVRYRADFLGYRKAPLD